MRQHISAAAQMPHAAIHQLRVADRRQVDESDPMGEQTLTLSPTLLNTTPSCATIASRAIVSWHASEAGIASLYCSQSLVLPAISVKRNLTVPLGGGAAAPAFWAASAWTSIGCES